MNLLEELLTNAIRDKAKLEQEVEQLKRELKCAVLVLAYSIKEHGGKIEMPDTFVLDYGHSNLELRERICPDKQATAYYVIH